LSVEEGAKFVAAAYAVILAVLIAYSIWGARRMSALQRDLDLLEKEARRRAQAGEAREEES